MVNDMLRDGAKASEVSYILTYVATELGFCTADNNLWVISTVLEGIGHASDSAAKEADKKENVRNAVQKEIATIQSGTEVH